MFCVMYCEHTETFGLMSQANVDQFDVQEDVAFQGSEADCEAFILDRTLDNGSDLAWAEMGPHD